MTIHYVDTGLLSDGTGSSFTPFNTPASVVTADGDTVLFKTGTVIDPSTIPATMLTPLNIVVGEYGTGDKPVITGGVPRADFVASVVGGILQRVYASNVVGNVLENDVPMQFVAFNSDIATTAALMPTGSFTFDYTGLVLYIKPATGSLGEYVVSEKLYCLKSVIKASGLQLRNLRLRQASRHALLLMNKRGFVIDGVDVEMAGGVRSGAYHLGNGYEFSAGCVDGEIMNGVLADIFDSAFTSQLYESSPAQMGDHYYHDMTALRCGMAAAEISIQTNAKQLLKNITVEDMIAENIGKNCWSGNRGGWVTLTGASAGQGNGTITGCLFKRITAKNAQKLAASSSTSGVNKWLDCQGVGITTPGTSSLTYGYGQADLLMNVLADGLAPSGGGFRQADCRNVSGFIF